jgi:hypothetical protein
VNNGRAAVRAVRQFGLAWACGIALAAAAVVFAVLEDLPIRDPDDVGPAYLRMPAIVLGAIALDIVPRVVHRAFRRGVGPAGLLALGREVARERWPARHWWFALSGVAAWYLCYAAFRNVKSMAPFVHRETYDDELAAVDSWLFAGHDPAALLHQLLGTGVSAHLLAVVYVAWIALVPATIAIALVWTRNSSAAAWVVTAIAVDWFLGAVIYVLLPTLGPIYSEPGQFADLPHTFVTDLQSTMGADRAAVLADPWAADTLQTIAAFASLHVAIMVTICLVAELIAMPRWVRVSAWVFLALTCLSTVYLGWHFVVDVVGGVAMGAAAVWFSGLATGNRDGWRVRLNESAPAVAASAGRPAEHE